MTGNDSLNSADNLIQPEEQNLKMPLYLWISGAVATAACMGLSLSGPGNTRPAPALNPYYTEAVGYPPGHSFKGALAAFLITGFFYLLADYFVIRKKSGAGKFFWNLTFVIIIISSMDMAVNLFTAMHPPLHRPHPAYLWELYPRHHGRTMVGNAIRRLDVNSYGFRGPEIKMEKEPDRFRIMILGDSAAFGYGVEENQVFSRVLEEELEKLRPGIKVQVINAAVSGYTTFSSSRMFAERGVRFRPDLVLIAHNNDSDADWDRDSARAASGGKLGLLRILYKSDLYLLVRKLILNRRIGNSPKMNEKPPKEKAVARVSPDELKSNLDAVFDSCAKIGSTVMVVSMPRMEDEDYTILHYRSIMKKTAEDRGGMYADLFTLWNSDEKSERLFMDDVHPDSEGHRLIGRQLALQINGFILNKQNRK